ncbi:hypothetical protein IJT17_03900 [bacterium]|nr:hypothetical protein [bacterium]
MTWGLYNLVKGRDGRRPSEFSAATLTVNEEWQAVIDCPNRELFRKLRDFFCSPLRVRVHIAKPPNYYAYRWQELEPGSEKHVREALSRLHQIGMIAVLLSEGDKK